MHISEEKRKIVNNLLDKNNPNKKRHCQELQQCLLHETNGTCCLYKYKPMNMYTLKSIIDNTLFCAAPNQFNDPFDCYIGSSFWDLYAEKMNFDLDGEWNVISTFFKNAARCNKQSKKKRDLPQYQRKIVDKIKSNEKLWAFLTQFNDEKNVNERAQLIESNLWIIRTILEYMIEEDKFKKAIPFMAKNYKIMFQNEYAKPVYQSEKQQILADIKTKAPEKEAMVLEIYQKIEETVKRLNATIDKNMRVGCLTTSKDDIRMWSYYANGHQGICIEYDYSQVTFSPKTTFPLPVIYSERRPTMPWRSVINNTEDNHNQDNRELAIGLLHKGQSWQDEKEWRIIIDSKQSQNFKMPPIKCIYLGAKIPDVEKALICQIAKDKNIPVKQMVLSETGFVLQAKAIVS